MTINIREPFYSAGKIYGWPGKTIGLGIDLLLLEGDGDLEVTVNKNPQIWVIQKSMAREFVRKYKSYFHVKGKELGVIAWEAFLKKEDIRNYQMGLFEI